MKFDVYFPFRNSAGALCPGVKPREMSIFEIEDEAKKPYIKELIEAIRKATTKDEQASLKKQLPSVCYMGKTDSVRRADKMTPTQLVMIDVDDVLSPDTAKDFLSQRLKDDENLMLAHITPRYGFRLVFKAQSDLNTIEENIKFYSQQYGLDQYGKVDTACKDFSRLSFMFQWKDLLYCREADINNLSLESEPLRNNLICFVDNSTDDVQKVRAFSDEEIAEFENASYRGTPLKLIIEKYVEETGEPSDGEKHNYYNEMVKNFRCIADNNKRLLLYLLPRFGHSLEECESQIKSICRVNTLSSLPKRFYFFLKDNGFYNEVSGREVKLKEFMLEDEAAPVDMPPYLPPVFRELVGLAPKDFVVPCVNALMPILGTLTSYATARYPYDDRMHTTSFFSIIYAPPSTGKGFVERFQDLLFEDLKMRDYIQSARENIYLRAIQKKGANDKAPDFPHTSMRLIPAKNSEAEFLQKQKDNGGYHMFTYAAEMDSWAKGARAAGGNKDDMIRIAWDNGEYGQQFKSANTFKGIVRLYWNVLISGTIQQIENYFKNVENGLVTRCSFTSIDNQEFALPAKWKTLTAKKREVIRRFTERCDRMSYKEPCNLTVADIDSVDDDAFDNEINWRFQFRPRTEMDCSWIMPVIDRFQQEQMGKAALDIDRARDVFRRRVGVRGFRLALLCMCLWEKPNRRNLEDCKRFVYWWMNQDIEQMIKLWGDKYNTQVEAMPKLVQRSVYNALAENFSKNDVYLVCAKQGIKTPIRRIIFDWKKLGFIEPTDGDNFKKRKNGSNNKT